MDNSLVISILAIILGPLLSIFIVLFTKKSKIAKNIPEDIQNINSEYELEKYLRHALCSNDFENKDKIIQIFENFFIDKRLNCSKLLSIWEANYCLFTLEDKTLANIKIAKNKEISDLNMEANYQEYLCNKIILSNHLSDSLNFSNFFAEFQNAKRKDKELCINLLSFLNEITSIKPNLKYLKKQLNSIDENISVLNKQYSQLSVKYFNSKELLSLYASYAKDIIYDLEKSALIEMKIRSFDKVFSSSIIDSSTFSFLNENNGILIISNEFENFGEILYANHKSAEILRLPLNNFINDNFFNFFHPYHKERISNGAKKFVQFSSSLETYLSQGFFLNLPNNLLECVGKLSVTVINNFIVSILIFREKEIKNQVALISDDYEIICHSANFQRFLGNPNNNFAGTNIKNLFFDSEEFDIKPFVAYTLPNFFNKMHLVYSYYEIYGIKVPYAILIKGDEGIKTWKIEELVPNNKTANLQVVSSLLSAKLPESFATFRTISSFQKENHSEEDLDSKMDLYRFTNEAPDKYDFSDKNDENKSQYSASSSQNKFLNMLQISSKSINILHLAFIFAVLTVLAVNIAVLVYAFSKINIISDVELPLYIGRAGKYFQQVALYSHMVFQCYVSQMPEAIALVPDIFSRDVNSLADFETLYSNMTIKSKNWNHCSGQTIINDVNVDLWPTDGGVNPKKVNLVKAVAEFINHGRDFTNKFNDSSSSFGNIYDQLLFLMMNGYGESLDYCYSSLNDIINCQESTMGDFRTQMSVLLLSGPIVLALCIVLIFPFYYSIFKIENEFWSNVRKSVCTSYFDYKQAILDRLRDVHFEENITFSNQKPSKNPSTFKSYSRYFWRAIIYFAIVSCFCLINVFYLYDQCAKYLSNRPEVIKNLIQSQLLYTNLVIWTFQTASNMWGYPFCLKFPSGCPFPQSDTKLSEILTNIQITALALRNPKFSDILSQEFKNLLYKNNPEFSKDFFEFGTYSAQNSLKFEMHAHAYVSSPPIELLTFMWDTLYIADFYDRTVTEIDDYSKSVINNQMNIIAISLAGFVLCTFVAYIGFYLPFFKYEKKYLQKINSILKIIPNK